MSEHYKEIAIEKLEDLKGRIDFLINLLKEGNDIYSISINGYLVDLLFEAREAILLDNF